MSTMRDNVHITGPAAQVLAGLVRRERRYVSKNGPVARSNALDVLTPAMRAYVIERCAARGAAVTQVRVVSPDEVIVP